MGTAESDLAERLVFSVFCHALHPLMASVLLLIGHDAVLTTTIDQETDTTKVTFKLDGVPTGLEDEIRANLEGY